MTLIFLLTFSKVRQLSKEMTFDVPLICPGRKVRWSFIFHYSFIRNIVNKLVVINGNRMFTLPGKKHWEQNHSILHEPQAACFKWRHRRHLVIACHLSDFSGYISVEMQRCCAALLLFAHVLHLTKVCRLRKRKLVKFNYHISFWMWK